MKYIDRLANRAQHGVFGSTDVKATPDGGLLYISTHSVTYIKADEEKPLIKNFVTKQPITEIDIDPSWSNEEKLFATMTISNSVLIWDLDKNIAISGHRAHCPSKPVEGRSGKYHNSVARMSFMRNRNLLSISPGELVVYCVASNSTFVRSNFVNPKGQITVLECSPYDEHIFACGTNKGTVFVCDLQKSCTLYSFHGHENAVVSLSWNAVSLSATEKKLVKSSAISSPPEMLSGGGDNDEIFNIYDYDYLENEFGAPIKNPDDTNDDFQTESIPANELSIDPNFNFTEACESLKQEISALNENTNIEETDACDAVTLADCQQTKNLVCTSSSGGGSNESTEGSLELVEHNSSTDDDSCHVDGTDLTLTEREAHCEATGEHQVPVQEKHEPAREKDNFDILLLSTSSDGKCYIRNVTTGSFCDQIKKSTKDFLSCKAIWITPTELLVHSSSLVRRQLNTKKYTISDAVRAYKLDCEKIELLHIATESEVCFYDQARGTDLLWYITKTRKVICLNTKIKKIVLSHDTVTSGIPTMCESPENTLKIAFSLANSVLCLMNAVDFTPTKVSFEYMPVRLPTAIKTLAWHINGYDLAYGTMNGQAGVINVDARIHKTFDTACARAIYSMIWYGEQIFFVCNDAVYAYKRDSREALKLEGFHEYYSCISAYEQFLIVGTNRGQIQVFGQKSTSSNFMSFQILQRLDVANHYITDIVFNPIRIEQFAVVANEASVSILNFDATTAHVNILLKLNCGVPKAQIHKVKWSNRQKDKLVTCGYDGDLRIFDLSRPESEEMIFSQQFHCPLNSAMFLPSDERYVICTGKSITVEIIDTEKPSREIYEAQSRSLDTIKWATQTAMNISVGGGVKKNKCNKKLNKSFGTTTSDNEKLSTPVTDHLIEKIADIEIDDSQSLKHVKTVEKVELQQSSNFLKKAQTALSLITKEQNKNPLLKIHSFITLPTYKEKREAVLIAKLFGQKIDAEKLLAAELANIKSTGTSANEIVSPFLNQIHGGGLRTLILDAIQTRQLKEWHVSVAPSVSYSFWKKCAQAFAEQLLERGHALQAAFYMLSLHKHHEAIEMLVSALYFKEAMLIGRVNLSEDDPLLEKISDKWIEHLECEGNLHAAALICTVSLQYRRGYEILSKQRVAGPDVTATIQLLKENIR